MIKNIKNFLIIFFIFQQLKSQISQTDQNGFNPFCNETLHLICMVSPQGLLVVLNQCSLKPEVLKCIYAWCPFFTWICNVNRDLFHEVLQNFNCILNVLNYPRVQIGSRLPGKVPLSGTFPGNPIVWMLAGTSPGDPTKLVGSGDERATLGS